MKLQKWVEPFFSVIDRKTLTEYIRACRPHILVTLDLIRSLKQRPRLYWDQDGHGNRGMKIRYRARSNGRWWIRYIGQVSLNEEMVLRRYCHGRWPHDKLTLHEWELFHLRRQRALYRSVFRECAGLCGWTLRGNRLHTGTIKKSQRLVAANTWHLMRLKSHANGNLHLDREMLAKVDSILNDPEITLTPRRRSRLVSTRNALRKAIRRGEQSAALVQQAMEDPRNAYRREDHPNAQR